MLARLGRLTAPRGARPRSFHHEAWLHDEKSPVTFPLTLCTTVNKDIPSSYLFHLIKIVVLENFGSCDHTFKKSVVTPTDVH